MHRFLLMRYRAGEARTSAMIAAMMGRSSHEQVLKLAENSFRVLSLASITEAHLATNADTDMFSLTQVTPLGLCDAFISHSWSDSGARKHEVLTEWHAEFREAYARNADVWLGASAGDLRNPPFVVLRLGGRVCDGIGALFDKAIVEQLLCATLPFLLCSC